MFIMYWLLGSMLLEQIVKCAQIMQSNIAYHIHVMQTCRIHCALKLHVQQ